MTNQVDRKDLKVQALLNRVTSTENENAELRVEIHFLTEALNQATADHSEGASPDVEEAPTKKSPK